MYTEHDLKRAIERYIHLREIVGLSRDTAQYGALEETAQALQTKVILVEEGILLPDAQTRAYLESKLATEELPKAASQ